MEQQRIVFNFNLFVIQRLGPLEITRSETVKTVADALASAKKQAKKNDLIFVGGSTFTVADIL